MFDLPTLFSLLFTMFLVLLVMALLRRTRLPSFLVALFAAFFVFTFGALAQEPTQQAAGGFLGQYEDDLRQIVYIIFTILGGIVVTWLKQKWNIDIDAARGAAIQSALKNAGNLVLDYAIKRSVGKEAIEVNGDALSVGIDYVKNSVPDAVKHFGLNDDKIEALLRPKIAAGTVAAEITKPVVPASSV